MLSSSIFLSISSLIWWKDFFTHTSNGKSDIAKWPFKFWANSDLCTIGALSERLFSMGSPGQVARWRCGLFVIPNAVSVQITTEKIRFVVNGPVLYLDCTIMSRLCKLRRGVRIKPDMLTKKSRTWSGNTFSLFLLRFLLVRAKICHAVLLEGYS